ncbi:hypothetical protein [Arthrobacter sp. CP30]
MPANQVMRHDVHDLAPHLGTYVHGRGALFGDAAHAMLPTMGQRDGAARWGSTMGQGANSSLEDGACIGLLVGRPVREGESLEVALGRFDAARRPRTQKMVRRSQGAGRVGADVEGRTRVAIRNTMMRMVPAGPAVTAGASVLAWRASH